MSRYLELTQDIGEDELAALRTMMLDSQFGFIGLDGDGNPQVGP